MGTTIELWIARIVSIVMLLPMLIILFVGWLLNTMSIPFYHVFEKYKIFLHDIVELERKIKADKDW